MKTDIDEYTRKLRLTEFFATEENISRHQESIAKGEGASLHLQTGTAN